MPNHTQCCLSVFGDDKKLEKMMKFMKSKTSIFDFDNILPYPKKFKDMTKAAEKDKTGATKDGFNNGGYEWCVHNWSTKWHAYELDKTWDIAPRLVTLNFQTAWSPPMNVIRALSKKFPNLIFNLYGHDEGGGFEDTHKIVNGVIMSVKNHQLDYAHVQAILPTYNGDDP